MRLAAAILMTLLAGAPAAAATLRMLERCEAASSVVTVSDIAMIEDATPELAGRIAPVVVAVLPYGAVDATITAAEVRSALSRAGLSPAFITVTGATSSHLTRDSAQAGPSAWAVGAIQTYLAGVRPRVRYAVSDVRLDFTPAPEASPVVIGAYPQDPQGPARFEIADAKDLSHKVGHVWATVSQAAPVVVAKRRISTGRMISGDDVAVEYRPAARAAGAVGDLSECLGRRAVYTISAGAPILITSLKAEKAVERGDQIVLAITTGGLDVSIKTTALENAAVGDVVRLRRIGARNEYLARITGPGRAEPISGGIQ